MADDSYRVELQVTARNEVTATVNGVVRDLNKVDRAMDELRRTNDNVTRTFSSLRGIMSAGIFGIGISEAVRFVGEMNELGEAANRAEAVFSQFGGDIEVMRAATRGAVDDLQLMNAANKLFLTGMAESSAEAAEFARIAVTLGGALGQGAAESLEQLQAAVLNMSYERLDSLGISAANTRARVQELTQAGMDAQEAFKSAVFEEANTAIEQLGDAAETTVSSIGRLQTQWANAWQDMAQQVNDAVNQIAGGLADLAAASGEREARRSALARSGIITDPVRAEAIDVASRFAGVDVTEFMTIAERQQFQIFEDNERIAREIYEAQGRITREIQQQNDEAREFGSRQREMRGFTLELGDTYRFAIEQFNELVPSMDTFGRRGAIGNQWLFSDEELTRARELAALAEQMKEQMAPLVDLGLLTPVWTDAAANFVDKTREFVEYVQEGVDAFHAMTLSQAFGETSATGMFGEIGDQLLRFLQGDLESGEFQELQDAIYLASGRMTEASIAMRDDVTPMLAEIFEMYGSEALVTAIRNLEGAIQENKLRGMTPQELAETFDTATGYIRVGGGGGGGTFTVAPGDTISGIAARLGISQAEAMRLTGTTDPRRLQPGTYSMGSAGAVVNAAIFDNPAYMWGMGGMGEVAADAQNVSAALDEWQSPLEQAYGKVVDVQNVLQDINATQWDATINVKVNDPDGILGFLTGRAPLPPGISATSVVREATRSNGGRVPGMDGRARPER